jgi:RNA polymerase sigma factor (sigma-70 family)
MSNRPDPLSLAEFCRAEWPRLVGSLGLYTNDALLAEDLAQETLARVTERWKKVSAADSPSAWAHRVAFNLAKSSFRRNAVRRRREPEVLIHDANSVPDLAVSISLREALRGLPDPQCRALVLRYFADLTIRETANVMRCPENTVKTHTRRGIQALRTQFGDIDAPDLQEDSR